jgi:hypothetical protein
MLKKKRNMRARGRERVRGGGSRAYLGHRRRSSWSAERLSWGDRAFGRVPQTGGEGDEWTVVRRRRRKASRQMNVGFDRLRQDQRYRSGVTTISSRFASRERRHVFSPLNRDRRSLKGDQAFQRYHSADSRKQGHGAYGRRNYCVS